MVFGLRSSVALAANLFPLIVPFHKQFACFFLRDLPICKHSRNFVETLLLFLCLVLWVQYIVWKDFRIPQDLNHGTHMFRREYSVCQCSGTIAEEFLLFLLLFFLSLHEGLHEGSVRSRCRHRRRFWSLHSGCWARISFQFFFHHMGFWENVLSREQ